MSKESGMVRTLEKANNYMLAGEVGGLLIAASIGAPAAAFFFANALVFDGTTTALYHGWKNGRKS